MRDPLNLLNLVLGEEHDRAQAEEEFKEMWYRLYHCERALAAIQYAAKDAGRSMGVERSLMQAICAAAPLIPLMQDPRTDP